MNSVNTLTTEHGQFCYSIQPVAIKDALGILRTMVYAYHLKNDQGDEYTIYKTKDGTWYSAPDAKSANNALLLHLKIALEKAG